MFFSVYLKPNISSAAYCVAESEFSNLKFPPYYYKLRIGNMNEKKKCLNEAMNSDCFIKILAIEVN